MQPPNTAIFQWNDSIKIKNNDKVIQLNNVPFFQTLGTTNSAIIIPLGTTQERPVNPVDGFMRFNTTLSNLEIYSNGQWTIIATDYSVLTDINPKTLSTTGATATISGQDLVPGMVIEFIGATNVTYLVNTYTYIDQNTITIARPANMPVNEEPYTLRVTMPNGPMYELKDIVEVGS